MAKKTTLLVLTALSRAAAEPEGLALYAGKTPGLFPPSATARQAAQRCLDDGHLRLVRTEANGKPARELAVITEKGLAYLLSEVTPRQVLEDMLRALEARQLQASQLLETARQTQSAIEGLKKNVETVLQQIITKPGPVPSPGSHGEAWLDAALQFLRGRIQDCPLPELYRHVESALPGVSIGQFHDGLRRLCEEGKVYLHPWTGPLYAMPEPPYALLVGHEVAYYASIRTP